ncbi:hypothetical protein [Desulforegula conservatrix]|uniref:hypothetical protein n=1 Tax=Desulforegula conservatrix TaxID=153026 RepID=UPI000425F8B5|nr:hypothetical protein [Desulforegula conservatrix]
MISAASNTRQKIWDSARELGEFTIMELRKHALVPGKSNVRKYIYGWENAGFIEKISEEPITYRLKALDLVAAPSVNSSGVEFDREQAQEQMWRTIFIIKEFSALDLAVTSSTEECVIKEKYARTYASMLKSAGYLKRNGLGRYRALQSKFTGPRPPAVKRVVQVIDRNTGKVVYLGGAEAENE